MRVNAQEGDFMTQMRRTVIFCTAATVNPGGFAWFSAVFRGITVIRL
jgi:hypothetical protein